MSTMSTMNWQKESLDYLCMTKKANSFALACFDTKKMNITGNTHVNLHSFSLHPTYDHSSFPFRAWTRLQDWRLTKKHLDSLIVIVNRIVRFQPCLVTDCRLLKSYKFLLIEMKSKSRTEKISIAISKIPRRQFFFCLPISKRRCFIHFSRGKKKRKEKRDGEQRRWKRRQYEENFPRLDFEDTS